MSSSASPKHTIGTPKVEASRALSDFREIEMVRPKDSINVAQQNRMLNRYLDVVPFDKYVFPPPKESKLYINGSFIEPTVDGVVVLPRFVACQAPVPPGIFDFLSTIVAYRITLVLMLTSLEEAGMPKADQYWPTGAQKGATMTVPSNSGSGESLIIEQVEDETVDDALRLTRRVLRIRKSSDTAGAKGHTFTQVQYTGWPDHGVPSSTDAFGHLIKEIEAYKPVKDTPVLSSTSEMGPGNVLSKGQDESPQAPPVVVHCSAGVGRTGTLIAAYAGVQIAKVKGRTPSLLPSLVTDMRKRRPYMVQRFEQYLYANTVILDHCGVDVASFKPEMDAATMQYNTELQERLRLMMAMQKK